MKLLEIGKIKTEIDPNILNFNQEIPNPKTSFLRVLTCIAWGSSQRLVRSGLRRVGNAAEVVR